MKAIITIKGATRVELVNILKQMTAELESVSDEELDHDGFERDIGSSWIVVNPI